MQNISTLVRNASLGRLVEHAQAACCAPMDELADRMQAGFAAVRGAPDLIPQAARRGDPARYARHLLHADPAGRFSIVALVWRRGQSSPVHGHHAWCAYMVEAGELAETSFSYDVATRSARPIACVLHGAGTTSFAFAGLDAIHKLGNGGDNDALSIHIYGLDGARVGTHVNRLVALAAAA